MKTKLLVWWKLQFCHALSKCSNYRYSMGLHKKYLLFGLTWDRKLDCWWELTSYLDSTKLYMNSTLLMRSRSITFRLVLWRAMWIVQYTICSIFNAKLTGNVYWPRTLKLITSKTVNWLWSIILKSKKTTKLLSSTIARRALPICRMCLEKTRYIKSIMQWQPIWTWVVNSNWWISTIWGHHRRVWSSSIAAATCRWSLAKNSLRGIK